MDKITTSKGETFQLLDGGRNSPIVDAEPGSQGKQSPTNYRFDLMDSQLQLAIANVFHEGAEKYGPDNWKYISAKNHINKALIHIHGHLAGDSNDDHLVHAVVRMLMACVVERDGVLPTEGGA